jgi:hypothetical protein
VLSTTTPSAGHRTEDQDTDMKALRQYAISAVVFAIVLGGLVSVDDRVRDRFSDLLHGSDSLSPWGDRIGDLGAALLMAVRHQSIDNAPLLVFATVGAVLFVFMFRT